MTSCLFPSLSVTVNKAEVSLADLHYALGDLHHLTETMVDHMCEMDFGVGAGRSLALERAYALAKIISDQVAMLEVLSEPLDRPEFMKGANV